MIWADAGLLEYLWTMTYTLSVRHHSSYTRIISIRSNPLRGRVTVFTCIATRRPPCMCNITRGCQYAVSTKDGQSCPSENLPIGASSSSAALTARQRLLKETKILLSERCNYRSCFYSKGLRRANKLLFGEQLCQKPKDVQWFLLPRVDGDPFKIEMIFWTLKNIILPTVY